MSGFFSKFFSLINWRRVAPARPFSLTIGQGIIEIEKGDITRQQVSICAAFHRRIHLMRVGRRDRQQFIIDKLARRSLPSRWRCSTCRVHARAPKQSTRTAHLHAGRQAQLPTAVLRRKPHNDDKLLRRSIADLIFNIVQYVCAHQYTSVALPAIGCGGHACAVTVVVKAMVREMKRHVQSRQLPWTV